MHLRVIPNALTTKAPVVAPALALRHFKTIAITSLKVTTQNSTIPAEVSHFLAICTQVKKCKKSGIEKPREKQCRPVDCLSAGGKYSLNYDLTLCRWQIWFKLWLQIELVATWSRLPVLKDNFSKIQAWRSIRKVSIFRDAPSGSFAWSTLTNVKRLFQHRQSLKQCKKGCRWQTMIE